MKQKRMYTLTRFLVLTGLLLSCLMPGAAFGQSADSYTIHWSVQDSGGGLRNSSNYTLSHSIGQTVGGVTSSNTQHRHTSGFIAGLTPPDVFDYIMPDDPIHAGRRHDADKTGSNDVNKCHAAAGSNILDWGCWDVPPDYEHEQQIFGNFQANWDDKGSLVRYISRWWIDGTEPPAFGDDWATVLNPGGGYFPTGTDLSLFEGAYLSHWKQETLIDTVTSYLHNGYGTTISLYDSTDSLALGHVLSVWGYRYDVDGNVLGLWVTDSDDVSSEPPDSWLLPIEYSMGSGSEAKWRVAADGEHYAGWLLEGVEALKPQAETSPQEETPRLAIIRKKCVDNVTGEEVACPADDNVTIFIGDQVCDDECKRITATAEDGTALELQVLMDPTKFKGLEVNGELWPYGEDIVVTDDLYIRPVIGCSHH